MKTFFETIGNATVVCYDEGKPIITTDPWIQGGCYFGSWALSHEVPEQQRQAILDCPYIWFSHGHPDHLNPDSINKFMDKTILLSDHVNGRIDKDLTAMGFKTKILPNREWVQLSDKIRVLTIADYFQDAIILIDINGRLLINTNDALDRGWGRYVRKIISNYKTSVLLSLFGYGDADMIHFYDEDGKFIEPKAASKRNPVGVTIQAVSESYGVTHCIPFSSMHRYQRTDSLWANKYATELDAYQNGFNSSSVQLLPAFIAFDCEGEHQQKQWTTINPKSTEAIIFKPEDFNDNWSDILTAKDIEKVEHYFKKIEHLHSFLDFICLRVGGKDHVISLSKTKKNLGLTFEVPRHSLMIAVKHEIFDDLLIGNFMKTTLHGQWPESGLYPDFTPYVARYADNAYVTTYEQLDKYMKEYRKRAPVEFFLSSLEQKTVDLFRKNVSGGSPLFAIGRKAYWYTKRVFK
ncbi:MAG: MBL fold metallo-hydrolase [Bdellovibrionota bacterium]